MNNNLPTTPTEIRAAAEPFFNDPGVISVTVKTMWGTLRVYRNGEVTE